MAEIFSKLSPDQRKLFKSLNTPEKIQDFLDKLKINFEEHGDTLFSPVTVLEKRKAQCLEGALFACAVLIFHKYETRLLDLQPGPKDDGHAVALFKKNDLWGAISKTNHAVLRYRDPIYKSPREVVMSYFHEYFLDDGRKTLRTYTVFDVRKIKSQWVTTNEDIWMIDEALDRAKYENILPSRRKIKLRKASIIEREAGKLVEWKLDNSI